MNIKAYKCTVSEIWRDFFCISIYCVYVVSLHTESTDSVIIAIVYYRSQYQAKLRKQYRVKDTISS